MINLYEFSHTCDASLNLGMKHIHNQPVPGWGSMSAPHKTGISNKYWNNGALWMEVLQIKFFLDDNSHKICLLFYTYSNTVDNTQGKCVSHQSTFHVSQLKASQRSRPWCRASKSCQIVPTRPWASLKTSSWNPWALWTEPVLQFTCTAFLNWNQHPDLSLCEHTKLRLPYSIHIKLPHHHPIWQGSAASSCVHSHPFRGTHTVYK